MVSRRFNVPAFTYDKSLVWPNSFYYLPVDSLPVTTAAATAWENTIDAILTDSPENDYLRLEAEGFQHVKGLGYASFFVDGSNTDTSLTTWTIASNVYGSWTTTGPATTLRQRGARYNGTADFLDNFAQDGSAGYTPTDFNDRHTAYFMPAISRLFEGLDYTGGFLGIERQVSACVLFDTSSYIMPLWEESTPRAGYPKGSIAACIPVAPFMPTYQRYQDALPNGDLGHMLTVSMYNYGASHIWPARRTDGALVGNYTPCGTVLRLRADYDLDQMTSPIAKVFARTLQRYGVMITDKNFTHNSVRVPYDVNWPYGQTVSLEQTAGTKIKLTDLEPIDISSYSTGVPNSIEILSADSPLVTGIQDADNFGGSIVISRYATRNVTGVASSNVFASPNPLLTVPDFSPADTIVVPLVEGTTQSVAQVNRDILQAAFNAVNTNGKIVFPFGTWSVHLSSSITIDSAVTVEGNNATFNVTPHQDFPDMLKVTAMSGTFRFQNFNVNGPTEVPNNPNIDKGCITWSVSGSNGSFFVENVNITGQFGFGVLRSGKGLRSVKRCNITAWEEPLSFFESPETSTPGRFEILECNLSTNYVNGDWGKPSSSIGVYVSPHIPGVVVGTTFNGFERFAVYRNGTATGAATVTISNCDMINCGEVQSTTAGKTILRNVRVNGPSSGTGSVLNGETVYTDSHFYLSRGIGFLNNSTTRTFRNCTIRPQGSFVSCSGTQNVVFDNCLIYLDAVGAGRIVNDQGSFTGTVVFKNCTIYDQGTSSALIYMQGTGGTLDVRQGLSIYTSKTLSQVVTNNIKGTILGSININGITSRSITGFTNPDNFGTITPEDGKWALPTVANGFTRDWLMTFEPTSNALSDFDPVHAGHQSVSNTRSYNVSENVVVSANKLTLKADDVDTSGQKYSSAYISTIDSNFKPLTGRYEAMIKMPMLHSVWPAFWMNAGGSSSRFELDLATMFTAQTPGRCSLLFHSPDYYQSDLRTYNHLTTNHWTGTTGWQWINPIVASQANWQGPLGATVWGGAVDWHDSLDYQNSPWVKVSADIYKIWDSASGNSRYTIGIDVYWNDIHILKYVDPFDPNTGTGPLGVNAKGSGGGYVGTRPPWVQNWLNTPGNTEEKFWDLRFNNWVGGDDIGQAVDGLSNRIYSYNGLLGDTTPGFTASGNTVPDANMESFPNYMEVAWVQRSVGASPAGNIMWEHTYTGAIDSNVVGVTDSPTNFHGVYKDGATITYSNTFSMSGGQSVKVQSTNGVEGTVYWDPTTTDRYVDNYTDTYSVGGGFPNIYTRFFILWTALPTANINFCFGSPDGGGTSYVQARLTPAGKIVMRDGFVDQATSTTTVVPNTWYCIEWNTNAVLNTQTMRIRSTFGALLEEMNGSYSGTNRLVGRWYWGMNTSSTTRQTLTTYLDNFAVDDSDWIGYSPPFGFLL